MKGVGKNLRMGFLIAPLIALFIVVLSACVMGLALFVVAALSGSYGEDRALCPANASGRRRDIEIGGGSAHA